MARKRPHGESWSDLPLFKHLPSEQTASGDRRPRPRSDFETETGQATLPLTGQAKTHHSGRASAPETQGVLPDWSRLPPAPPGVHFGTSSWAYPGWFGQVYDQRYRASGDTVAMLEAYARCPLFDCVGVDSSFYRPPSRETLAAYRAAVPEGFAVLGKVYERFTIGRFTRHRKWGTLAGRRNPDFLDPVQCTDQVVGPWLEVLGKRAGPLIFEFQTLYPPDLPEPQAWGETLERFFEQLPSQGRYAVEVRNPELLHPSCFESLRRAGVSHVFNAWTRMPPIRKQLETPGALTADFVVARALLRPGRNYQSAVDSFKPYNRIQEPQPDVRQDIVRLVLEAIRTGRQVFVLVNNRLEGNAPGTIEAIRSLLADAQRTPTDKSPATNSS